MYKFMKINKTNGVKITILASIIALSELDFLIRFSFLFYVRETE